MAENLCAILQFDFENSTGQTFGNNTIDLDSGRHSIGRLLVCSLLWIFLTTLILSTLTTTGTTGLHERCDAPGLDGAHGARIGGEGGAEPCGGRESGTESELGGMHYDGGRGFGTSGRGDVGRSR